jgi:hypothetical protein
MVCYPNILQKHTNGKSPELINAIHLHNSSLKPNWQDLGLKTSLSGYVTQTTDSMMCFSKK